MMTRRAAIGVAAIAFTLGGIASHFMPQVYAQASAKAPEWKYGMNARVRRGDEPDFGKNTRKVGVEVYLDENNGTWIYISETGSIAVTPKK
jgi:hypothetical protein